MQTKEFKIEGMSCGHCVKAVEIELNKLKLESKEVTVGNAKISFDENQVKEAEIISSIEEAGYKVI